MIEAARIIQPDLKGFAIVGTPLKSQLYYSGFANELPDFSRDLEFIDLMGLSVDAVKQRVAMLPDHTVIFYIGINFFEKTTYVAAELVKPIAEAANRPVVVNVETFFGSGAVGGFIITPSQAGEDAGHVALRILAGEDAASIGIINGAAPKPIFDWRQLQRWNISESRLPSGSEIRFRQASLWEQNRWQIAAIVSVILLQAALIAGLIYEHRRRRVAEVETRERMAELAHMNRHATAGELSASIAHELNQPLGAILANAETMEAILKSPSPDLEDVKTIINDIKRDDERATEVILRLRRLLKKAEVAAQDIEINQVVRESIQFISVQAAERNVILSSRLNPGVLRVSGDPIQLQQVILNLMTNAMDSVTGSGNERHEITSVTLLLDDTSAQISISDSGSGIPSDKLMTIFEPFFTTKENGMGMGLSISRSIVEAHHGRIWAENRIGGGAVFHISLPLARDIRDGHC